MCFFVYLFMQELFVNKIHFFKFLSSSGKPWLDRLKIITVLLLVSWYKRLLEVSLVQARGNTNKEMEIPCAKNKCEPSATYQAH